MYAEDEARLLVGTADTPPQLEALVVRRVAGEPLEQILGWAEFGGIRIYLEPGGFVPRRGTELVVDEAARIPRLDLYAVDLDPVAVRCARGHLSRRLSPASGRARAQVLLGDLFTALPPLCKAWW